MFWVFITGVLIETGVFKLKFICLLFKHKMKLFTQSLIITSTPQRSNTFKHYFKKSRILVSLLPKHHSPINHSNSSPFYLAQSTNVLWLIGKLVLIVAYVGLIVLGVEIGYTLFQVFFS